jgi:biotin transport system substrate-specific component
MKLAGIAIPAASYSGAIRRAARIAAFVGFTAAGAQLAVRLPFTPVPITMQTLFVVLAGAALGPRDGFYAMLSYIGLGLSGAPIFAGFGFGPATLFGPTGGYLMSFPAAAALCGFLVERFGRTRPVILLASAGAMALILFAGALYLELISGAAFGAIAAMAIVPFIAGESIKAVLAAFLAE